MAGGVSDADAHTMACEMRCDPADIRALAPRKNATQFLTYIDGVTPRAVPLTTPFFTLENMARMSEREYQTLIAGNRRRYCETAASPPPRSLPQPRPGASPRPPARGRGVPSPKTSPRTIPKNDDDWRS